MSTLLKKLMFLLLLLSVFVMPGQAQTPCGPLPPPGWIDVINITPNSADAYWEGVAPGAWYEVELKNINTGLVEDLTYTQLVTKSYNTLASGTQYRVTIGVSTCQKGQYGATFSIDFFTPSIIIEDVVWFDLNQTKYNRQRNFAPADMQILGPTFPLCILKVDDLNNINTMEDVFHAYIKSTSSDDFYEFTLVGSPQNRVIFPLLVLRGEDPEAWATYYTSGGMLIPVHYGASSLVMHVHYNGVEVMRISGENMQVDGQYLPISVWIDESVQFFASDNNSGPCPTYKPAPGTNQNPITTPGTKAQISPNPFTDYLNLNLLDIETGPVTVRILDATGRLQFEATGIDAANDSRRIETADWQPGMYYLQIQTEKEVRVQAIVKL